MNLRNVPSKYRFQRTASKKLINWNIRDSNAFLLLVTSVLLKRKDESVVRQICAVLLAFGKIVNEAELKNLARVHGKVMRLILHKMSKVATYFTQQKLLEVLLMILRANDDGGAQVFNSEKLIAKSRNPESAFFFFERLEPKDFLVVSVLNERSSSYLLTFLLRSSNSRQENSSNSTTLKSFQSSSSFLWKVSTSASTLAIDWCTRRLQSTSIFEICRFRSSSTEASSKTLKRRPMKCSSNWKGLK